MAVKGSNWEMARDRAYALAKEYDEGKKFPSQEDYQGALWKNARTGYHEWEYVVCDAIIRAWEKAYKNKR